MKLTTACLLLLATLTSSVACWSQSNRSFIYWGAGIHNQQAEVTLDLREVAVQNPPAMGRFASVAQQEPESVFHVGEYGFGPRFFVGRQFNNFIAAEAGTSLRLSSIELNDELLNISSGSMYAVDFKLLLSLPLSEFIFVRAHLGTRFHDELLYRAQEGEEEGAPWSVEETRTATNDLTQGVGLGYSWSGDRAVVLNFERLDRGKRPLDSFGLSLMLRM